MAGMMQVVMRNANKVGVGLYRRTEGRIGGRAKGGLPVLLLTVPGRRTGSPRTTPVGYFEHDGGYLVVGSAGGMKDEPQWIRNLGATPSAQIRLRERTVAVGVRMLTGDERDSVFGNVVLAQQPYFADYEKKSGRTLKLAVLTPVPPRSGE